MSEPSIADLRRSYARAQFDESDADPDPVAELPESYPRAPLPLLTV